MAICNDSYVVILKSGITRVFYSQKYLIKPLIFAAKTKIKVFKVNGKPGTNPSSHGHTAKQ